MMQSAVMERKEMSVTSQGGVIILGVPWLREASLVGGEIRRQPLVDDERAGRKVHELSPPSETLASPGTATVIPSFE